MRILLLLLALLSGEGISHSQTPTGVPSITVVHTWGDLVGTKCIPFEQIPEGAVLTQDQPAGHSPDSKPSFRIWLGIDRDHATSTGAVLLYCLVKGIYFPKHDGEDNLGPFRVEVKKPGPIRAADKTEGLQAKSTPAYSLYAKAVPLAGPGDVVIELCNNPLPKTGMPRRVYAQVKIHVEDGPHAQPWSPWAETMDADNAQPQPAPGPGIDPEVPMTVGNPSGGVALPRASICGEGIPMADLPPGGTSLPELLPEKPDPDTPLTMEGNVLRIKVQDDLYVDPDNYFLTRWWVNGKPWLPDPSKMEMVQRAQEAAFAMLAKNNPGETRVRFDLHFKPERLGVKKGNRVGVQLLFCPKGWQCEIARLQAWAVPGQALAKSLHNFSSLSNRIDFIYSGDPLHPQQTLSK